MLVFIPSLGEFVIPELLLDPETLMIGNVLWQDLFCNEDWLVASATVLIMLAILILQILLFNHYHYLELQE